MIEKKYVRNREKYLLYQKSYYKKHKSTQSLIDKNKIDKNWIHRKLVADRLNFCECCNKSEEQNINETGKRLSVHHIDCNKNNNFIDNLKVVCDSCHKKIHLQIKRSLK